MRVRFLFLNQFYPPDLAPTGRILHSVATTLVGRGHSVRVICSRRAYAFGEQLTPSGLLDGVEVERVSTLVGRGRSLSSRGVDDASFLWQAAKEAMRSRSRPQLLLALSSPPFLGVVAALVGRWRGIAHAQWTMDLYPDVLEAHWQVGNDSLAGRALGKVARFQFGRAALVLTLGTHMAQRISRHVHGAAQVRTIPLWSDLEPQAGAAASNAWRMLRGWSPEDIVLLYSGNMGRGHRFGEFLEAARRFGPTGPVWAFVGGGARRGEIERFRHQHPTARIDLCPYVSSTDLADSLSSADVHLVSLSKAWQGLIVPSKLQAAFAVGRPVIFVGPPDNEIAKWIVESGGGWVVAEGDVDGLTRAVLEATDRAERNRRGQAAHTYAQIHFNPAQNCGRIADLLEEYAEKDARAQREG
jgi:putative colanic acid biosynthesis glycosyltransferase WcaI